jgi:hypothetical protein
MFAVDSMLDLKLRAWNFWAPCFVRIFKSQPQLLTLGRKDHDTEKRMKRMASELPSDMETSSPGTQAGNERGAGTAHLIGVAVRPTLLFMTAFALNVTPHEAAHATAGYILGFSSTLYQMWVNPDAATATPGQIVAIAVAGPIFSLTLGLICAALYVRRYKSRPSGLLFLMLAVVGLYSFLGPVAADCIWRRLQSGIAIRGRVKAPDECDFRCRHSSSSGDDVLHGERTLFLGAAVV